MSSRRSRSGSGPVERRLYRVSEPRQHPLGFTQYRVTATIISKKTADVKEVTVYKRYSDFKKLHGELSYIHRNLFRKLEEFPAFPKAQVFGRFDEAVIEERRHSAEEMLQFTVNIPALHNSPQLKDFFKDGEACWPLDLAAPENVSALPEPLIPLPPARWETPGSCARTPDSQRRDGAPRETDVSADGGEDAQAETVTPSPTCRGSHVHSIADEALPDRGDTAAEGGAPSPVDLGGDTEEDERGPEVGSALPDSELALFDPCAKEGSGAVSAGRSNLEALSEAEAEGRGSRDPGDLAGRLLTLRVGAEEGETPPGDGDGDTDGYLSAAAQRIKEALGRERAGEYGPAFTCYRSGVDILLAGLQGEPSAERQDAIKKRTAEYMKHAEAIFALHLKDTAVESARPPS
ncbi:LOW QUALITY PROTEIN: sorting nexin-15 [Leucoraja erinacea]|uniref:LOW QUALITY PROTEIN: sorting nexin-15 n=1 Tax=Leucoraja erinaceus TaxID=7782 RepID=UPI002457F262|nr:LOW QUALITY PROTEIN: sorting nexin-15 [Leucoraja erinacea]